MPVFTMRTVSLWLGLALALLLTLQPRGARAAEFKVLHDFCEDRNLCLDGFTLSAGLMRDSHGNLYGTAFQGGKFFGGTVFRLEPGAHDKWKLTVLHDFCAKKDCADGFGPQAPVIIDQEGNLYGTAAAHVSEEDGNSVIYRLHPNGDSWDYQVLYEFCHDRICDGAGLNSGLSYVGQSTGAAYDGVSPLFGVAAAGGPNGAGVAFMLEPKNGKWKHTDIYAFCTKSDCSDGRNPSHEIVVEDALHLVGVTSWGNGGGTVFRLTSQDGRNWSETVLHAFCSEKHCADGGGASNSLSIDPAGNFYGTTPTGGHCARDFRCGTLFKIAPDGTQTVLFDFCRQVGGCKVGSDPEAGPTVGADGTLYGTTLAGGQTGAGVIWAFDGRMKKLHTFCCGGNSRSPMIIDPQGHLFGVLPQGGAGGAGQVYELTR